MSEENDCEHLDITDWHLDEQGHNCNSCGADVPCIEVDGEKCERGEYQRQSAALLAERDELREALRARLENDFHGDQCSRCLGAWDDHVTVCVDGGALRVPCPLTKPCALVGSRHPAQPIKGTPGG